MKLFQVFLVTAIIGFLVGGCGHFTAQSTQEAKKVLVDCAKQEVVTQAVRIIPTVNSSLHKDNFMGSLENLAASVESQAPGMGLDVVACVLQAATRYFGDAVAANPDDEDAHKMFDNAQNFLKAKGVVFLKPQPIIHSEPPADSHVELPPVNP